MTHMTKDSGMNGLFVGIILIALGAVVFGNSLIGSGPAGLLVTPIASTAGPAGPYATVEIEQGATTMR